MAKRKKTPGQVGSLRQSPKPSARSKKMREMLAWFSGSTARPASEPPSRSHSVTPGDDQPPAAQKGLQYSNLNCYQTRPYSTGDGEIGTRGSLSPSTAKQHGNWNQCGSEQPPYPAQESMYNRGAQIQIPHRHIIPNENDTMLWDSGGSNSAPGYASGGFPPQSSAPAQRNVSFREKKSDGNIKEVLECLNDQAIHLLEAYHVRLPSSELALQSLLDTIPELLGTRENEIGKLKDDRQQVDAQIATLEQVAIDWHAKFESEKKTAKRDLDCLRVALEASFDDKEAQIRKQHGQDLRSQRINHDAEVRSLRADHAKEVSELKVKHDENMARLEEECKNEVADLERKLEDAAQRHKRQIEQTGLAHDKKIAQLTADWKYRLAEAINEAKVVNAQKDREITAHRMENERLSNRMAAYSTNRYRAIPDKEFAVLFGSLEQRIIDLSSNTTSLAGSSVDAALNPHGFIERRGGKGRNWVRLVRNACWTLLLRGFFSRPVGFGAFGADGTDCETLNDMFALFTSGDIAARSLPADQEANAARAWYFAMILQSVTPGGLTKGRTMLGADNSRLGHRFQHNIDSVAAELSRILQQLGGGGGSASQEKARDIAADMGLLALRVGSQRAHVLLETCTFGESGGRLGEWFKHESEGALPPGPVLVDLMVQPCLRRVGDGYEDTRSQKILAQGVFLAQK